MRVAVPSVIQPTLLGAGCTSAAGDSVAATWDGILSGRNFARGVDSSRWTVAPRFSPRACLWSDSENLSTKDSARTLLVRKTLTAYREALAELTELARERIHDGASLGVVLATTKGALDDEIWRGEDSHLENDFLSPVLTDFLRASELSPARTACVSNACASALSAFALARDWLAEGDLADVLVLAVDRVGPFVLHGFHSLRAVTGDVARPFAADRSGLLLGEASAALFLSSYPGEFRIAGVGIDAEGFAVTRPEASGTSLATSIRLALRDAGGPPDLVLAHGTATEVNDPIEARALADLFPKADVPITGTKGSLGHTLGASGAIDLILAREVMRRGAAFTISQTTKVDPAFIGNFLASPSADSVATVPGNYSRVLVTSLGFGGIHAAAVLERRVPSETFSNPGEAPASAHQGIDRMDTLPFAFPVKAAPDWAARVERWYQLDAYAFGLAEAAYAWCTDTLPEVLYLASPSGSNVTDAEFARAGARSPALFVHSLPNVRSSAFCQVAGWHGPIYCLQNDPGTFAKAVEEARRAFRTNGKRAWVLGIEINDGKYLVHRFRIGAAV
jgi:3-oxoacyl-(acyl-carrier-protein) synthase